MAREIRLAVAAMHRRRGCMPIESLYRSSRCRGEGVCMRGWRWRATRAEKVGKIKSGKTGEAFLPPLTTVPCQIMAQPVLRAR